MQTTRTDDFDRQVKSLLEDAGVKAPRSVWKSVRGSLEAEAVSDPADGSTSGRLWMAAGMALAAAAVAAVLLVRIPGPELKQTSSPAILALSGSPEPEPEGGMEQGTQDAACPAAHGHISKSPAPEQGILPYEEDADDEVQASALETQPSSETPQDSRPATGGNQTKHTGELTAGARDLMAFGGSEDAGRRSAGRAVLEMRGMMSSNDVDFITRSGMGRMAPGTGLQRGINEESVSIYGIPISVGVGARFYISDKLSLGTGLEWSLLTRTFNGTYVSDKGPDISGEVFHSMHYLGIPVDIFYDVFSVDGIRFYVHGGAKAEVCLSNTYDFRDADRTVVKEPVSGLQYSTGAGIGVEFSLGRHLGLYLDPGAQYYFNCSHPKNVRTDKPFMVSLDAGLRFRL